MPDSKISDLPAAISFSDTDITPVVQGVGGAAETRRATFAQFRSTVMAERPLHVRDYGAVGNGTTDDTAAFQAALNAASSAGGGVVLLGPRRYLIDSAELIIPPGVTLQGGGDPGGFRINNDYGALPYCLVLNPARTVRLRRNSSLEQVAIVRKGFVAPSSIREALDCVAAFSGTAVSIGDGSTGSSTTNATDASVRNLLIVGFTWGVYSNGASRTRIRDVVGDCTNGLYLGKSFDIGQNERINWHPLATTGRSFSSATYTVAGCANNGAGLVRLTTGTAHELKIGDVVFTSGVGGVAGANGRFTVAAATATTLDLAGSAFAGAYAGGGTVNPTVNHRRGKAFWITTADMPNFVNCFEYGHDIGWHLDDLTHSAQFVNCGVDGVNTDPGTIGVQMTGICYRNKWYGGFWSSKGRPLVVNSQSSDQNVVAGVMLPAGTGNSVEVIDGALVLMGCDLYGSAYLYDNADSLQILGCDMKTAAVAGQSVAAMQKVQISGTRMSNAVGVARAIGGQSELAAISSAGAIETRLSARADGIVAVHRRSTSAGAMLRLHGSADTAVGALGVAGTDVYLQGDAALNPNPSYLLGNTGMTQPLTLRLRRLSASPAANDRIFALEGTGLNSAAAEVTFGRVAGVAEGVAAGAEAGALVFETRAGGTVAERMRIASSGTVTVAGPLMLASDPSLPLQAATKTYVDNSYVSRAVPSAVTAGATALTFAAHNARMVIANAGTTLSLDWSATGHGFACMVVNRTGADLAVALTGFSAAMVNPDGYAKVRAGAAASLLAFTPDGGTTRLCQLAGGGAP
ncbi:glycosyl hydrolase family 28-related protein [Pararoseomonas indoligenes]|uniref:Rhamnogalacturonase A/B/Epimerase-like pectate lyase domain-containing protein n=1 Tax=Roseomonas indoligenes TaxID=2820811 RepID=A0A940MWL8_9PROT|nr:glycosyl hydrolase family 28-related protein [Pararoseomonas indoligenes]MBP0491836.1 hypothetical protein [Pararoseomonas indoligenes]